MDFWATWCGPCRAEIPHLVSLYDKYENQELVVLGIGLGKETALRNFAKAHDIMYPILLDIQRKVSKLYNVTGIPAIFIIDRKGKVAFHHVGFRERVEIELEKEIRLLLGMESDDAHKEL